MDKEALEKMAVIIEVNMPKWQQCTTKELRQELVDWVAAKILVRLTELGYRKLPKDKPPLLADVLVTTPAYGNKIDITAYLQAQREADIKWYGGE